MKIIPNNANTNLGEMKVLQQLRSCKDERFKDWIVYHSLNYPVEIEKNKKISYSYFGEADFVFLIPNKGVINVEVKGGDIFSKDGEWYSRDFSGKIEQFRKSPLKQASDTKYDLRRNFEKKIGKKIPQEYLLILTKTSLESIENSLEISKKNIIDRDDFTLNFFEKLFKLSNELLPGGGISKLDEKDLNILKNFIRPNFENYVKTSSLLKESEIEIHKFTSEQLKILDYLEDYKRLLIDGTQGTGKSVMAEEILKRKVINQNKKILFLNSNKLASQNIKSKFENFTNLKISTFTMFLREINKFITNSLGSESFTEQHEEMIENAIIFFQEHKNINNEQFKFDIIIFDEMQNACSFKDFYAFLDIILNHNLIEGEYYFFGDFNYQKFFGDNKILTYEEKPSNFLIDYKEHTLIQNVRNCKKISTYAPIISGLFRKFPYEIAKNDIGQVESYFEKNTYDKVKKLEDILIKLYQDGVKGSDITILSDFSLKNKKNYLNQVNISNYYQIVDLTGLSDIAKSLKEIRKKKDTIFFSTTSGFQGMENKIIIYLEPLSYDDIYSDLAGTSKPEMLAFNGMGRAQTFLYIIWDASREKLYSKNMSLLGTLIS